MISPEARFRVAIRVQCTLPHRSMLPTDVTVNTFHLAGETILPSVAEDVAGVFEAFYSEIQGYLSNVLLGALDIKMYRTSDPEPRVPAYETNIPAAFQATTPTLPEEAAVAISLQAVQSSGVPAARRRGRVFIGPLSSAASSFSTVSGHVVPESVRQDLTAAMATVVLDTQAAGHRLGVWSRVDSTYRAVMSVSVDDALDTIRSRGHAPTTRTVVGPIA